MNDRPVWKKFVQSRKLWVFVTAFITLLFSSLRDGGISLQETEQMTLLAIGYIASVALEDGLSNINPPKEPK